MKKKFTLFFAVFAFAIYSQASVAVSFPIPDAPKLDAEAYILIDAKTGEILAEYNADKRRDPASLTKIMTSYVVGQALKSGNITNDEMVTVSRNAWAYVNPKLKGSSLMFLEAGKKVSIADLNRGIIIESGNDAAIAIAEHIAGNQAAFIQLMNDFAQKLGLKNTRFNTVHGLDAAGQYTTAKDMAFLGQALIRDLPTEYEIYKEKEFTYALKQPQLNRNGLLWDKTLNVDGIKTGHTKAAGFNLVASAVEGDTRLISAVLGGRTYKGRELETKKLLVWGFRFFETTNPIKGDVAVVNQPIWYGNRNRVALGSTDDVYLTVPKGRSADVKVKYQIDSNLLAPVAKGSTVGTIQLILDDKTIEERPLIVLENVNRAGFFGRVWDWIHLQINKVISLII